MPEDILRFRCDHCLANLRVDGHFAGKKVRCPKCRTVIFAPQASDTDLFELVRTDRLAELTARLESGADMHQRDKTGRTLLHVAVELNRPRIVAHLIDLGADVGCRDHTGSTPLHIAAANDNIDLCRLLLNRGARRNEMNNEGLTPADVARRAGHVSLAEWLDSGGDDSGISPAPDDNEDDVIYLDAVDAPPEEDREFGAVRLESPDTSQIAVKQGVSGDWERDLEALGTAEENEAHTEQLDQDDDEFLLTPCDEVDSHDDADECEIHDECVSFDEEESDPVADACVLPDIDSPERRSLWSRIFGRRKRRDTPGEANDQAPESTDDEYALQPDASLAAGESSHSGMPSPAERTTTSRSERREEPDRVTDLVQFTATWPQIMVPGETYTVDIWAHLDSHYEQILQRAQQQLVGGAIASQSKAGVQVVRGTVLTVRLQAPGLQVEDDEDCLVWTGQITNATFLVRVPDDCRTGTYAATASICVGTVRVARLPFVLTVGQCESRQPAASRPVSRYRTAFASYATPDRDEVLKRVQGMQKVMPDLDVFIDVASLRSGQHWQQVLESEIVQRDVFYLFWSKAARESQWVRREWQTALNRKGIDCIDPVPLEPPDLVPPPPELADDLHFNDWMLAYLRRQ